VEGLKLLKPRDVAERLQLPVSTVYFYAKTGKLPVVFVGTRIRFKPESIEEFINLNERKLTTNQ